MQIVFLNFSSLNNLIIWIHLLLPTHWPIIVAGLNTFFYWRKISHRGIFFLISWIFGYGLSGLVSLPWPLVWIVLFDKQATSSNLLTGSAVLYIYLQSVLAILITLWFIHVIVKKYWQQLYP